MTFISVITLAAFDLKHGPGHYFLRRPSLYSYVRFLLYDCFTFSLFQTDKATPLFHHFGQDTDLNIVKAFLSPGGSLWKTSLPPDPVILISFVTFVKQNVF